MLHFKSQNCSADIFVLPDKGQILADLNVVLLVSCLSGHSFSCPDRTVRHISDIYKIPNLSLFLVSLYIL